MIILLKNKGYEKVSLSVNKDNYAYRMYEKLGFQVIREKDEDYLMVLGYAPSFCICMKMIK